MHCKLPFFYSLYLRVTIFLIGFMGSGKTSIGKVLAKQLDFTFMDMDAEIEKKEKMSIAAVFNLKGENYFRNLEQKWLENFDFDNVVVSVGGGTPCFNNNMDLILRKGVVVYLNLPIAMMAKRVMNAKTIRPLIEAYKNDWDSLLAFMTTTFNNREPYYRQADILFEASNMSASKKQLLADMIKRKSLKKGYLL